MSDVFKGVKANPKKMEEQLLGCTYPYQKYIKTPKEMGMGNRGSMSQVVNNAAGVANYINLLIFGSGNASMTGKPLGNRQFLKTPGQCRDINTKKLVDRYMYIDNIPTGNIPLMRGSSGARGLVVGIMEDIANLMPLQLISGFTEGAEVACSKICKPTMTCANRAGRACRHVALSEQRMMRSGFVGSKTPNFSPKKLDDKPLANIHFFGISILLIYIFFKMQSKI